MFDSLKNFFGGKKQPDGSEAQQPEAQPENALKKAPLRFTLMICTQNSGHIDYR